MNPIITETYRGIPIPIQQNDCYVNATAMCQVFGKRPVDFLRLPSTRQFQSALAQDLNLQPEVLVEIQQGGNQRVAPLCENLTTVQGTWLHPDLALECARWLSPEFAIWCNRTIRRILSGQFGQQPLAPPLPRVPQTFLEAMEMATATLRENAQLASQNSQLTHSTVQLAVRADHLTQENGFLAHENGLLAHQATRVARQNAELTPKAEYFDQMVAIGATTSIGEAAQLFAPYLGKPIGEHRLFEWMRNHGWLYRTPKGYNKTYQSRVESGQMENREEIRCLDDGREFIHLQPRLTKKGMAALLRALQRDPQYGRPSQLALEFEFACHACGAKFPAANKAAHRCDHREGYYCRPGQLCNNKTIH